MQVKLQYWQLSTCCCCPNLTIIKWRSSTSDLPKYMCSCMTQVHIWMLNGYHSDKRADETVQCCYTSNKKYHGDLWAVGSVYEPLLPLIVMHTLRGCLRSRWCVRSCTLVVRRRLTYSHTHDSSVTHTHTHTHTHQLLVTFANEHSKRDML